MRYIPIFLFLTPFACAEDKPEPRVDQVDTTTEPDCTTSTFYLDNDSDGYGNLNDWVEACDQPEDRIDTSDCDDTDATINPEGVEVCNDKDDDCNGLADDGVGSTWYADSDGDGFGNANSRQRLRCRRRLGWQRTGLQRWEC